MDFSVKTGRPEKQRSGCLIVAVHEDRKPSATAREVDKAADGVIGRLLASGDLQGAPGETLLLQAPAGLACDRLLLVGCGKAGQTGEADFRKAADAALAAAAGTKARDALCCLTEVAVGERDAAWKARQVAAAAGRAVYRFNRLKSGKEAKEKPTLRRVQFPAGERAEADAVRKAAREGVAINAGVDLAKDLGNLPGNICTPTYLANEAKSLARKHDSLKATVLGEKEMEKLGMGALLAVARGSRQPAKLIVLEYKGSRSKRKQKPIVLVGKGLTFDAGGISIKPAAAMDEMKYDMGGGAAVLGTMRAVAELGLPINVTAVVPSSENLPDGAANKPGDVLTSMSGQTIEVLNTDAEGRLILCDALTYSERFDPAEVIDVATLTGAVLVSLGRVASGLLANDDTLAQDLLAAGTETGDRAWQLPLWDDYQELLKSNFADMANIGGRDAGTITAACFLSRFTKKFRWAHLDIAGTGWLTGDKKGGTGRPVPLLTQHLINRAAKTR